MPTAHHHDVPPRTHEVCALLPRLQPWQHQRLFTPGMSIFRYHVPMPRYRLVPTTAQALLLRNHCAHARFVWNLAVEQQSWWRPGRASAPGWAEQCRQLSAARHEHGWLAAGSVVVQQQALRDFAQAMVGFFAGTHRKPTWRKVGRDEGFRIVALRADHVRRLNRHWGQVFVPKAGWVRFRWSRAVPEARSYRVKLDSAGRWHIAFAAVPDPIVGPGTGQEVGVDWGVAVSAALSTGELLTCPHLSIGRQGRLRRLQRKLARAERGSNRRARLKSAIARLRAREADARKDWAEKLSTDLARRFDVIRVEDLRVQHMTRSARGTSEKPGRNVRQKAGLNREMQAREPEVAREPSRLPVHRLRIHASRGHERGQEHRGRACRDRAARLAAGQASEPRTPACSPTRVGR